MRQWRERAACSGRTDLDWFDKNPAVSSRCLAICDTCPVADSCLIDAIENGEPWGIWGGLNADERREAAVVEGKPAPRVRPPHATNSRYAKHGCRCALCRAAHTAYDRERRARTRAGVPC